MTKEAKMGLLLGLAFIVAIAVVLRGVHRGTEQPWEERLSIDREVVAQDTAESERLNLPEAVRQFEQRPGPEKRVEPVLVMRQTPPLPQGEPGGAVAELTAQAHPESATPTEQATRYEQELPKPPGSDAIVIQPDYGQLERALESITERPATVDRVIAVVGSGTLQVKDRLYVVEKGDDISKIALKLYGPTEGKRWVNVNRIYEANRKILTSIDDLQIGQKLAIPVLPGVKSSEAVTNLSRDGTATDSAKSADNLVNVPAKGPVRVYEVQEGDSLWSIAEEQLGDAKRYKEIILVDGKALQDHGRIFVGMRLRLPAR